MTLSSFLIRNQPTLSSLAKVATFNDFLDSFMTHSLFHSLARYVSADVTYSVSDCVKSFCGVLCHVGALKGLHWGWWPTDPMPPIKCWQRWAQNMLPFLPIASGDAMATRRKKSGPPRHSTHALASIVKCLKSSTSVFFRAEITKRALMWNLPPFISSIFPLFSPCSPSLKASSPWP